MLTYDEFYLEYRKSIEKAFPKTCRNNYEGMEWLVNAIAKSSYTLYVHNLMISGNLENKNNGVWFDPKLPKRIDKI